MPDTNSQHYLTFEEILELVHEAGRETIAPHADDVDKHARFPSEGMHALKKLHLMSAYVPKELGGMGLNIRQIAEICEALGHYCASTAMIYAMHKIQVACIIHHSTDVDYFKDYLRKLVTEQRLIASATTEIKVGGDLMTSLCAVEPGVENFKLVKKAPVISYAEDADDLMITARNNPEAASTDQVSILLNQSQYEFEPLSDWDTLGFRGTCSSGFTVTAEANKTQIADTPFAQILSQTMQPYAHIVWSSLWSGIAASAVNKARTFLKNAMRRNPDMPQISSVRLGEVSAVLNNMRSNIEVAIEEYTRMLEAGDIDAFTNFGFTIRMNNLKLSSSQMVVDIVGKCMMICGIASYRNNSELTLGRHLRDAYGASLMVNNDRIMLHNSTLLMMHKGK